MPWYILVVGPYDCCFTGPFRDERSAQLFRHDMAIAKPQFDFYIFSHAEYEQNQRDFGAELPMSPRDFIHDTAAERTIQ